VAETTNVDMVTLTLSDGRDIQVNAFFADLVCGVDEDGDPLVPLFSPEDFPVSKQVPDHAKNMMVPLTPCCQASGKGSDTDTGVCCRVCYRQVDVKYGGQAHLAVPVVRSV